MKVAILFSGQVRDGVKYIKDVQNFIINGLNPDVYIHSYQCEYISEIEDAYQPICSIWENPETTHDVPHDQLIMYRNRSAVETKVDNMLNMWRKRQLAFSMLKREYERIIVARFDAYSSETFVPYINKTEIVVPSCGNWSYGLNDMFASGPFEKMQYYCNLISYLPLYLKQGILFHPETMLRFHLDRRMDEHYPPVWEKANFPWLFKGSRFG